MKRHNLAAALVLALFPAAALAQGAAATAPSPERAEARAKVRAACAADVQRFCADVERGKGMMRACLEQHKEELSAGCLAARAERAAARAAEKM